LKRDGADLGLERLDHGIRFWIHVSPRARRDSAQGQHGDALRVAVKAPPVDGRANAACVAVLAQALGMRRGAVEIDPRSSGRRKRVFVRGEPEVVAERLRALATAPRVN